MEKSSYLPFLACILSFSSGVNSQVLSDTTIKFIKIDRNLINKKDANFYNYIENLNWEDSLTLWDESMINAAIDSINSREMQPNIIIPVLVHRLYSISQKDTLGLWESFRKYLMQSPELPDSEYDDLLLKFIDPDTLQTKIKVMTTHYHSNDDDVLQALVIRQCKLLRRHEPTTVDIPPDWLNPNQTSLFKYSRMEEEVVIDSLFNMIQLGSSPPLQNEDDAFSILVTYGRKASHKALVMVLDSIAFHGFSHSGQEVLLMLLTHRAILDFTDSEKSDLIKYLNTENVYKGVMKDYVTKIAFITSRITDEGLEKSLNRVGYTYDQKENKIVPLIQQNNPK